MVQLTASSGCFLFCFFWLTSAAAGSRVVMGKACNIHTGTKWVRLKYNFLFAHSLPLSLSTPCNVGGDVKRAVQASGGSAIRCIISVKNNTTCSYWLFLIFIGNNAAFCIENTRESMGGSKPWNWPSGERSSFLQRSGEEEGRFALPMPKWGKKHRCTQ